MSGRDEIVGLAVRYRQAKGLARRAGALAALEEAVAAERAAIAEAGRCPHCLYKRRASSRRNLDLLKEPKS